MTTYFWILTLIILLNQFQCATTNGHDHCSEANIQNNLQQCLNRTWERATDKNAFWFGTQWTNICGSNPLKAPYCTSLGDFSTYKPHSLLNTIYGLDWDFSQNPLTKFLHVTYQTETGSYTSCGNTYTVTDTKTFTLEPLLSKIYHPWETKTRPTITWTTSANTLYTLIVLDARSYVNHGVYINIIGNEIDNAEVLKSYNGPKNPTSKEQPYVFLLYEQAGQINITDEWRHKLSQVMVGQYFNFTDALQELQLQGPVAMNWIVVVKDPYSVQYFVTTKTLNNCPDMVTEALKSKNISFIPDNVDLSMSVDIELQTTDVSFESCCKSYTYPGYTAKLNHIGDDYISSGRSRSGSDIKMSLLREGLLHIPSLPSTQGVIYTLAFVDTDVPFPDVGTPDLPLLHMLVTNINNSNLTSGDVIQSYRGPAPPDYVHHTYFFLLYRQNAHLSENDTIAYLTEGCRSGLGGRCLFNVTRFTDENDLQLVGASWFLSTTDEFVRNYYITRGQDADDICKNVNGYANPCPVGAGHMTKANLVLIALVILYQMHLLG